MFSYLIRLFVILPMLIVSFTVSSCLDTYGVREMEKETADFKAEIELVEKEILKVKEENADLKPKAEKPAAIEAWIAKNIEDKSDSLKQIQETEKALRNNLTILKACEISYRSKSNISLGQSYGAIRLKSGRTLKKVTVKGFDQNGLNLMHSGGIGVVPVAELPDELSSQISIPPQIMNRGAEIASILAKKPRSLMSSSEQSARQDAENEEAQAERDRTTEKRENEYEEERAAMEFATAVRRKEVEEKATAYREVLAELKKYKSAERNIKKKVFDMKEKWKYMNLPPSASDQQSALNSSSAQLQQIQAAISALEIKKSALY